MYNQLQMFERNREKSSIPSQGCGLSLQFLHGCWMLVEQHPVASWLIVSLQLDFSLSASAQQHNVFYAFFARKKEKTKTAEQKCCLAKSNVDCLLFCHPALSLLQNKHSLVSFHLCLKRTFCVPFRHTRALRHLLLLLHKWNKSLLCKKWWGHGKKGMILLLRQAVIQIPGSL